MVTETKTLHKVKCAYCGRTIKRTIYPYEQRTQKNYFCNNKCNCKYQGKAIKGKSRVEARKDYEESFYNNYSALKPSHCPAQVESCLDCPFEDCIY